MANSAMTIVTKTNVVCDPYMMIQGINSKPAVNSVLRPKAAI